MIKTAIFDFDGTLIRGDSIVRFVRYAHARGLIGAGGLLRAALWAAAYGLHLTTAERAKRESLSFLAGREQAGVEALGRAFCREEQSVEEFDARNRDHTKLKEFDGSISAYHKPATKELNNNPTDFQIH